MKIFEEVKNGTSWGTGPNRDSCREVSVGRHQEEAAAVGGGGECWEAAVLSFNSFLSPVLC